MSRGVVPGVVAGYLSVDHSVALQLGIEPGRTALVGQRLTGEDGRLGGCVSQIALGLAAERYPVEALSWVGPDRAGSRLIDELSAGGVGVGGIDRQLLDRTATTWLCYAPDGLSYCIYDPGGPLPGQLSGEQAALAAGAPWCIVAVGPPEPTTALLDLLQPAATLVWAVKADPLSFIPPLAERLAAASHVILWSETEASFLAGVLGEDWRTHCRRPGTLLVETRGADGCVYIDDDGLHIVEATARVPVHDPTGAGDRFAAGLFTALLRGEPTEAAVRAGEAVAASFLARRAREEEVARTSVHDSGRSTSGIR